MRGQKSDEGSTRIAPNGYHYSKEGGQWRLTHHILAEKKLGRPLMSWERVKFVDGNRRHLDPKNLIVVDKGGITPEQKIALLEARINQWIAIKTEIEDEMVKR